MSDGEETGTQITDEQKIEIAKWFLLNCPAGEIQYVAKDIRAVLNDEKLYRAAAAEAFPLYNKSHMICLGFPVRSGEVLVTSFNEIDKNEYLDPRTAQVAIVDHVKQVCKDARPASDEEFSSSFIEEYRCALDAEIIKYVSEAYPKGVSSVYCVSGKDVDEPGSDFELVVVISAVRHSPQNFCNGSWWSIWNFDFKGEQQFVEARGKLEVVAHYFEEGNVQLDAKHECKDSTIIQSPDDSAVSLTTIIRHHEMEYLNSLQVSTLALTEIFSFKTSLYSVSSFCRSPIQICLTLLSRTFGESFLLPVRYSHGITPCNSASLEISRRTWDFKAVNDSNFLDECCKLRYFQMYLL